MSSSASQRIQFQNAQSIDCKENLLIILIVEILTLNCSIHYPTLYVGEII